MKSVKFAPTLIMTLALLFVLTACYEIEYPVGDVPFITNNGGSDKTSPKSEPVKNKYKLRKFDLNPKKFTWKDTPSAPYNIGKNADEETFSVSVDLSSAQHYRVSINAQNLNSGKSAVISLSVGGEVFGAFYVSSGKYETFSMDNIYLQGGKVELVFSALRGSVLIESVALEDSSAVLSERYKTVPVLKSPASSLSTQCVFDYLNAIYGNKVLTAQYCTVNTNIEINAVREVTGRAPAIRMSDLASFEARELELALEWSEKGGIVFYTWTWRNPEIGFSLEKAVAEKADYRMDEEQIRELAEAGMISEYTALLFKEIDELALALNYLAENDVPVLFNPVPDGGSGLYWWSSDKGRDYVWLWKLIFERLAYYHGLDNLIFVWSGGSYDYYPGDNYVDIIGETVYKEKINSAFVPEVTAVSDDLENSEASENSETSIVKEKIVQGSEAVRFGAAGSYGQAPREKKLTAVSDAGNLPAPDSLFRDNALWLFWGIERGDYVVESNGNMLEFVKSAFDGFYNHELSICLDELPDVKSYGIL